jgi:peroxiredoxin
MKQLITGAFLLCGLSTFAQQHFTVAGKIGDLDTPARVYLNYRDTTGQVITDTASLHNGAFTFKGSAAEITDAMLLLARNGEDPKTMRQFDRIFIILENGTIRVNSTDSIMHATVSGTPLNDDYAAMMKIKQPLIATIMTAEGAEKEAAVKAAEKVDFDYIQQHPKSYMSLLVLQPYVGFRSTGDLIAPAFNTLSAETRRSRLGHAIGTRIEDLKRTDINAMAPVFSQPDANGKMVSLSSFRGKYVLVDFWASWCKPCRAENPNVVNAYNQFKDKNFVVLGVSLDYAGAKSQWLEAIAKDHLEQFTQVAELTAGENSAAKLYNVIAIPENFLVGPDGKIIAKNLRGEALQAKLASILN